MNTKHYYNVGGHVFSVSRLLDFTYEPFQTQAKKAVFDVTIKMQKFGGILKRRMKRQTEKGIGIFTGKIGEKLFYEFKLLHRRAAVLLTDKRYKKATLFVEEFPKYSIDSALMVMYALSTATRQTLLFHSSVVMEGGFAYMFLGKSGTGKSTHSQLWMDTLSGVDLLNDDNPIVRVLPGGIIHAYGSPWSGKTPCWKNDYSVVGGIIQLDQAKRNKIEKITEKDEAYSTIFTSVSGTPWDFRIRNGQHKTALQLMRSVPFYHLDCRPDREAAIICHNEVRVSR